jgi:hypothetical protein
MAKSKFENFEVETIHRSRIKNAEYNPRFMGEREKKRLRAALKENGLVSALTWNRRTGNLVGGHQRLEQLDALEKNEDYELTVCVVDVDEKQEAKLNVQLNNPSMQGEWDVDKLYEMTQDFDLSMEDMGFSSTDAAYLFDGDEKFVDLFETPEAQEEKGKLKQIKEARQGMSTEYKNEQRADFMLMVVFKDAEERADFMRRIHVPGYEQYVTVEQIERITQQ